MKRKPQKGAKHALPSAPPQEAIQAGMLADGVSTRSNAKRPAQANLTQPEPRQHLGRAEGVKVWSL
jgi:hypothetical protein